MAVVRLRREEQIGLALAVALHAALLAALLLRHAAAPPPMPQPISVTLSTDTGLTATAPSHADAAADVAPTLGTPKQAEAPAPVASPPPPRVEPLPAEKPMPAPRPVAVTRPRPQPVARPVPVAIARPQPKSPVQARSRKEAADEPAEQAVPAVRPAHKRVQSVKDWSLADPAAADHQPQGGSRIGNDFLKGVAGGKPSGKAAQQGAAVIGPELRSALSGAIARQLKPHWVAPQGADADRLVTFLSWDLNRDGSLARPPHVVRQEGITDSNRPQAARHAEQAIRAVQLAAPFQLPAEYYDLWKHVGISRFDRTLSQ